MKGKISVLMSITIVIAGTMAWITFKAHSAEKCIYVPAPGDPITICCQKVPGKQIITTTSVGGIWATTIPCGPCTRIIGIDVIN